MMPRKLQFLLLPILLACAADRTQAQATAYSPANLKTELFGGFSTLSIKPGKNLERRSLNGWTASVTSYQFFRRWGLTAEFGRNVEDGTGQRSYLFGGTFRALQRKRIALTGAILAGGTTWEPKTPSADAYREQTAFTFGFSQSIDLKFSDGLALRVQPGLRFVRFQDPGGSFSLALIRPISVGLVYQFGRR